MLNSALKFGPSRLLRRVSSGVMMSTKKAEEGTVTVGNRFNKSIDLTSDKVVHSISIAPGEKIAVCRCWQSAKFPLCDGSHGKYNKATGDNLGPALISVPKSTV